MRFEARELKAHAEPVSSDQLEEGQVYFSVQFADDEMLLPRLEPLIYIGSNLDHDDESRLYFQDVDSYRHGIRYESAAGDEAAFVVATSTEVKHLFEYEQALEVLMGCSLRRRRAGSVRGT